MSGTEPIDFRPSAAAKAASSTEFDEPLSSTASVSWPFTFAGR